MISGTIDGVVYVNMANVKIVRSSDEQGNYWSTDFRTYNADVVYEHELLQLDRFMNNH